METSTTAARGRAEPRWWWRQDELQNRVGLTLIHKCRVCITLLRGQKKIGQKCNAYPRATHTHTSFPHNTPDTNKVHFHSAQFVGTLLNACLPEKYRIMPFTVLPHIFYRQLKILMPFQLSIVVRGGTLHLKKAFQMTK